MKQAAKFVERQVIRIVSPRRFLPIQLDITNACNLSCSHCYHAHHKNKGALRLEQWMAILSEYGVLLKKVGFDPFVILCGGEPLSSSHLAPIVSRVRSEHFDTPISILTNGTLISRFDFSTLEADPYLNFQISLDGPDAESHDLIRGRGSFASAIAGASRLRELGLAFSIQAVLAARSAPRIAEFFTLAKLVGARSMDFTRMISLGQAKLLTASREDRTLSPDELRWAYRSILYESARTLVQTSANGPLFRLIHPRLGRSGRFAEGIVVDYQGFVLASSRSKIVLGHAIDDGLETTFLNHPILRSIRKGNVEGCGECRHFRRCGGDRNAAYASTGNYLARDPGCWLEKPAR